MMLRLKLLPACMHCKTMFSQTR